MLRKLRKKHPNNACVQEWASRIKTIYDRAKAVGERNYTQIQRCHLHQHFEEAMLKLALPYRNEKKAPQRVLSMRIETFLGELFSFIDCAGVPADNNAAKKLFVRRSLPVE